MLETSTENHTAETLMAAFQRGAGVQPNWQLTPEFMEMLGKLVATSIGGAHSLLGNRAELKRDIHADATVVVVRNNNPLKFLPDSLAAKTQMLRKKMPGFMGPVEALEDAFADLAAHQKCVKAGMEGAVAEALKRLAPETLAARHRASPLTAMLPPLRKAALWDHYCEKHAALAKATSADFHASLGDAFLAAYERKLDTLE
ncbi:type VI secretion system-associated FHA domain protein TagH [Pseudoduganella eburnea]|jgi:type VI secretion system FHA domain protein|uniref:Type VI secretion system-associated FHA domain protein TagH n=1 Tax=Massilia eburnea TaxID=1776165 RepID=A0A6L6QKV9_9BURK|nr:type VI secretion system-associated FHA domain protein TagH [Massilia eburnea]MTW12567.1 type VI secretion system-associated FHA domain protein TagH [Massilia eburnea]